MDPLNPLTPPTPSQPQNLPPTPPTIPPRPQQASNLVPPPPAAPDVRVRTMESDAASAKSSGGGEPEPQFVTFPAPTGAPAPEAMELAAPQGGGGSKALIWLIALIIVLGAAWGAYAYLWPMLNLTNPSPVAPAEQAPVPAAPAEPQPAVVPAAAAPAPAPSLGLPPGSATTVVIDTTPTGIIAALAKEAATEPEEGDVREFVLSDTAGPVSFTTFLGALLPEAQKTGLIDLFSNGFSPRFASYAFYDEKGIWPGYVIEMDPARMPNVATLAPSLQKLESSSYANFFLSTPGTPDIFRTGQVKSAYVNRFVPLSQPGASFNYGIFGKYVIINTSYGGLLKALDMLKL